MSGNGHNGKGHNGHNGKNGRSGAGAQDPKSPYIVDPNVVHEVGEVNTRGILSFVVILTISVIVVFGGMALLFQYFEAQEAANQPTPQSSLTASQEPPAPRLQLAPGNPAHPLKDMKDLRDQENAVLSSYGWADKSAGTVHVPILDDQELKAAAAKAIQYGLLQSAPQPAAGQNASAAVPGANNKDVPSYTSSGRVMERSPR